MKIKIDNSSLSLTKFSWFMMFCLVFFASSSRAISYPKSTEYQNNIYYQVHALTTAVNASSYLKNDYHNQAVLSKINHLFDQVNHTHFSFQQNLKTLWQNLPKLGVDSSLSNWYQANLDRFMIVNAFELVTRSRTIELIQTLLHSFSSDNRIKVIELWHQVDKQLLVYLESEQHSAFHHWRNTQNSMNSFHENLCNTSYILAHRGGSSYYPENSLSAFRYAFASGSDGFECDVRLSQDGVVFVLHDKELERLTGKTVNLDTLTSEQVLALKLRNPLNPKQASHDSPLLLEQLLAEFGKKTILWLELKPDEEILLAEKVGDLLERYNLVETVIVSSFSQAMLDPLRNRFPNLNVAYEFSSLDNIELSFLLNAPDRHRLIISADHLSTLSPEKVSKIQQAGIRTSGFTLNRFDAIKMALEQSVTYIQTDKPYRAFFLRSKSACPIDSR